MSKILTVLELLRDGRWHEISEIQSNLRLNEHNLKEIIIFLNSYSFIEIDDNKGMAKINREFREILAQPVE